MAAVDRLMQLGVGLGAGSLDVASSCAGRDNYLRPNSQTEALQVPRRRFHIKIPRLRRLILILVNDESGYRCQRLSHMWSVIRKPIPRALRNG